VSSATADLPEELRETATSLAIESPAGAAPTPDAVLAALLEALTLRVGQERHRVLDEWRGRDALRGRRIAWSGGTGTAAGVDDTGALLVETSGGMASLDASEVHLQMDV
jgi:biotin-(acetyl-CoA carboxylase) ligase